MTCEPPDLTTIQDTPQETNQVKRQPLSLFDQLLVDFDIELKESLAIRMYQDMDWSARADLKASSETIRDSFDALDSALASLSPDPDQGSRREKLASCRRAIQCLVRFFGLSTKRDPRAIIRSSSYKITRKEPRLTPYRE